MSIKIAIIGANQANVEEITDVVVATLGRGIEIVTATIDHYRHLTDADLYVCLVNRKQEMEDAFGPDNIVALEFIPPVEYFLALSRIPVNTPVIIFNNSTSGTRVLMEHLQRYNLMHLAYDVVAYDETDPAEVAEKIAAARLITGGVAYVGPGKTLHEKFGSCLSADTTILVSPPRIATSDSISHLCHAFANLYQKAVMSKLQSLATTDYLTNIPNRRTFDEVLDREWGRARRENSPLSMAMIDIDLFKNFNDHYGHASGDQCLQKISQALQTSLRRPADFCARYGGEEFAVILPNTDSAGALQVLENFRLAVVALAIVHGFSSIASFLTVSIGYTTIIPDNSIRGKEAFDRADRAVYAAKFQGRNKTVCFESLDCR